MNWWHAIMNYYETLGKSYGVDPAIFVGIHIVATPLFAASVWWIIYYKRKKKSLIIPAVAAMLIFNSANIYLVSSGKNIPWWIYGILLVTTLISSYFSIKEIKKRLKKKK